VLLAFFIWPPALCDADRNLSWTTLRVCADPLRPVRQDCVCRRARARQRHLIGVKSGSRPSSSASFDLVLAIHRRFGAISPQSKTHVHGTGGTILLGSASSVPVSPTALFSGPQSAPALRWDWSCRGGVFRGVAARFGRGRGRRVLAGAARGSASPRLPPTLLARYGAGGRSSIKR